MNSSSTLDDTNGSRDYFDALIDAFTADEFSENSGNESTISSSLIRPKRKKRKKSRKAGPKPKAVKEYYSTPTVVNCVDQSGKQDKQLALSLLKQEQDLFEHHGVSQILVQFFQMEPGADDDIDGTDAQLLLQLRVSNVEDAFVGDNIDEDHATLSSIIDRQLSDDLSQLDGQQEGDVFGDDEIDRQYFKYVQEFRGQDPSNTCLFSQILQFISTKSEQAVSTTDNGESDSESDVDDIADNQRVDGRPSVTIQQQLPQDGVFKQYFTSGVRTGGNSVIINVEKEFRQSRPVNTQKEYAGPVKEWREFCQTLGLTDFVYEIKMLAYLKYVVSNIAVQRQINDRVKGKSTSYNIMCLHVRALIDLWRYQSCIFPQDCGPSHPKRGRRLKIADNNFAWRGGQMALRVQRQGGTSLQ
ncbi:hypothetical protein MIR68_005760 [Amoeboaphelidium protococcarum]|nr:hypothetical protein MIR68_005760 [Amoeboaphelidium protococcarum]